MTNLLLYAEARDRLDQLTAQPSPCDEHPLSYPDDLYEELNRGEASAPVDNTLLRELFDSHFMSLSQFAL